MRLLPLVVLLAACPGNPDTPDMAASGQNPPQVWLALNGSELKVHLVPQEPPPF
jgi:hypothetical protein